MRPEDIPAVYALSRRVHTDYPERETVLAEKLALFPAGCFVLAADAADGAGGRIVGYAFSHPWVRDSIPSLDTLLIALPEQATTYFIHDVTLDEGMRGQGHAASIVPVLVDVARACRLPHMMLVAVNGAEVFWERLGFAARQDSAPQASTRDKYGAQAVSMEHDI